jgi:hypothetical protein
MGLLYLNNNCFTFTLHSKIKDLCRTTVLFEKVSVTSFTSHKALVGVNEKVNNLSMIYTLCPTQMWEDQTVPETQA